MSGWWLRTRQVVSSQFAVVVVALVVVGSLSGWVAYGAHVDPGTHEEEREVSSWSTTTEFDHSATVTASNPVYPVGTTLSNRTTYFSSIAPELDGAVEFEYAATDAGNLTATVETWLEFRRVSRDRDDGETVYWRTRRELGRERIDAVRPGERVRVPFDVDVSRLANRSERIEERMGRTRGETEAVVRASVALNGTVNGHRVSRTDRHALPIAVGDVYRVDDPGTARSEAATTRAVAVQNAVGPLRAVGAPLLFALSLAALAALVVARWRGTLAVTSREREHLAYRDDRSDFDEWINAIELPDAVANAPRAEADSLGDLVDFAIDTDNSVIEDPDENSYHVLHDGYHYVYEPPPPPDRGVPRSERESAERSDGSPIEGQSADETPDPLPAESAERTD